MKSNVTNSNSVQQSRNENQTEETSLQCQDRTSSSLEHEDESKGDLDWQCHEWILSPYTGANGIRCEIHGEVLANRTSDRETFLEDTIGRRGKVWSLRGGIPVKSSGDKSYPTPEYSREFHKQGSTLPAVNFSRSNKVISDTFIPLQSLPIKPRASYTVMETKRRKEHEIEEVLLLDNWKPAEPLKAGL